MFVDSNTYKIGFSLAPPLKKHSHFPPSTKSASVAVAGPGGLSEVEGVGDWEGVEAGEDDPVDLDEVLVGAFPPVAGEVD